MRINRQQNYEIGMKLESVRLRGSNILVDNILIACYFALKMNTKNIAEAAPAQSGQHTLRSHIVIQPCSWYEGETLCCGWGYLSDAMPEAHAHAFARAFPETKVCTLTDAADLVEGCIRKPALRPCPFCGSNNVMPTSSKGAWFVECLDCRSSSRQFFPKKLMDAEIFRLLAENWNKRDPDTSSRANLAAARAAIAKAERGMA